MHEFKESSAMALTEQQRVALVAYILADRIRAAAEERNPAYFPGAQDSPFFDRYEGDV